MIFIVKHILLKLDISFKFLRISTGIENKGFTDSAWPSAMTLAEILGSMWECLLHIQAGLLLSAP